MNNPVNLVRRQQEIRRYRALVRINFYDALDALDRDGPEKASQWAVILSALNSEIVD